MAHGQVTVPVPGELMSTATDGRVVSAEGVYDYNQQKSQEQINQEVAAAIHQGGGGGSISGDAYTKSESDSKFATKAEMNTTSETVRSLSNNVNSISGSVNNLTGNVSTLYSNVNSLTERVQEIADSIDSGSGVIVEPVSTADDSWNNFNLR
jgi:peptidoglycan hydrolase CwlO-like protein